MKLLHPPIFAALVVLATASSDPAPTGGDGTPAPNLREVHFTNTEISWDWGDQAPDWRKEITGDDPNSRFDFRWRHLGPEFDSAALYIYDENDTELGSLPLNNSLEPDDASWRLASFLLSDLPGTPPLTMRVRLFGQDGEDTGQIGSASPEVQVSPPTPADPFLYTPLYLDGVLADTGVPGIAAGVWCRNSLGAAGERRFFGGVRRFNGGLGPVEGSDLWQWGSNTKAMTCTALAILIERGTHLPNSFVTATWDTPLTGIFPELLAQGNSARATATTLRHLACHRSGIHRPGSDLANITLHGSGPAGDTAVENRRAITFRTITRDHRDADTGLITLPDGDYFYENTNYLILGAVIDRLAGVPCETFMQNELFTPLGMASARFGLPVNAGAYQPRGHKREAEFPFAIFPAVSALSDHDMDETPGEKWSVFSPAGAVTCSITDALKFCRLHLNGNEGALTLQASTLDELHTPYPLLFPDDTSYAWGWGVNTTAGSNKILSHDGSVLTFYSRFTIHFGSKICAVSSANCIGKPKEGGGTKGYGNTALDLFHTHLMEKAFVKTASSATSPGFRSGNSGGSLGISDYTSPLPGSTPDSAILVDVHPLGEGFFPVSIHLSDRAHQRRSTIARAPRVTGFERTNNGLIQLTFTAEENLTYRLYGASSFPFSEKSQLSEFTAGSDSVVLEVSPPENSQRYFYQVRDLK